MDTKIKAITGFQKSDLPMNYLGCPLHLGRSNSILISSLINKLQSKLGALKGKIMSLGAKLTLIRFVLMALPSYLLALIHPPKSVIKCLNTIFSDFFGIAKMEKGNFIGLDGRLFVFHTVKGELGF